MRPNGDKLESQSSENECRQQVPICSAKKRLKRQQTADALALQETDEERDAQHKAYHARGKSDSFERLRKH